MVFAVVALGLAVALFTQPAPRVQIPIATAPDANPSAMPGVVPRVPEDEREVVAAAPEPSDAPSPPVSRRRVTAPRPPDEAALRATLEAALEGRGLQWRDMDANARERWARRTPDDVERLYAELLAAIRAQPIARELLAARLSTIARHLGEGRLSKADLERFESRYLDLTTEEAKARTDADRVRIAKRTRTLLADIKRAEKR
jgi:hypothetical protein